MENQNKKNTAAGLTAANESTMTSEKLLKEILPLLKEYFICKFEVEKDAIKMNFLNGDTFKLTAEKCTDVRVEK